MTLNKINQITAFFRAGKLSEAKKLLNKLLSVDPMHSEAWYLFALIAEHEGLTDTASEYLKKALSRDPHNLKYLYTIGDIYYKQNLLNEGVELFELIVRINPKDYNGFYNLAVFQQKQKRYDISLINYKKVLELDKNNINSIYNIGDIYIDMGDYISADTYFKQVIELQPNSDDALTNLGFLQLELGDFEKAIEYLYQAIYINPENFNAINNLGKVYERQSRYTKAIEYFDRAIKLKPEYAEAYFHRGVAFDRLSRHGEAIIDYDKAISLNSEFADAYCNKSHILLSNHQYEEGWKIYNEWRWKANKNIIFEKFQSNISSWNGVFQLNEARLLLWAEQGIGDEIFYFGILNNFAVIHSKLTISVDKRLIDLFKRSIPSVEFIDRKQNFNLAENNNFDYQAPIGDIPYLFSVYKFLNNKCPEPFLKIDHNKVQKLKHNHQFSNAKLICGISWKSSNKEIGFSKSIELIDLLPLLSIDNIEFVSLQYGVTTEEINFVKQKTGVNIKVIDDLDIYNDIDGLIALISICNFVVTTSSITAHLTGSIGKKGMVLLPFSKGKIWYWHSGEGESRWYPSLELVSQTKENDWTDPIYRCTEWVMEQM